MGTVPTFDLATCHLNVGCNVLLFNLSSLFLDNFTLLPAWKIGYQLRNSSFDKTDFSIARITAQIPFINLMAEVQE